MTIALAWVIAQVIKFLLYYLVNKKLDFDRLLGDGGMPSSHSAVVTSCATFALLEYGANSFEFTIAAVLAIIVMHDAMGVRLESGKQAKAINDLNKYFEDLFKVKITDKHLEEFLGHTPFQVLMGLILGVIIAVISYNLF